jgi:2-iminobutanoate/2-iminopropanoate deaminase
MTDLNEFQKMNAVYAGYFEGVAPARETVEISRLPMDATIEISCIAIK